MTLSNCLKQFNCCSILANELFKLFPRAIIIWISLVGGRRSGYMGTGLAHLVHSDTSSAIFSGSERKKRVSSAPSSPIPYRPKQDLRRRSVTLSELLLASPVLGQAAKNKAWLFQRDYGIAPELQPSSSFFT